MIDLRKRIEQLLNGKFEYSAPGLVMKPDTLTLHMKPGERIQGSFFLSADSGVRFRGFLFSSNPRMQFEPAEFVGITNEIRYQADANGMSSGMEEKGVFTICSELGEHTLPYSILVEEETRKEEENDVPDVEGLAALAGQDFQKAYRCFISEKFGKLLEKDWPRLYSMYEAIRKSSFNYQSFEEFLNGAGVKEPVEISVDADQIVHYGVKETAQESFRITRHGWGFTRITLRSDAPFVRLEKSLITTDEFAGSAFDVRYVLDHDRMHEGNNYAQVRIDTVYQTIYVRFTVKKAGNPARVHAGRIRRRMQFKLENYYVSFRLQKQKAETWISRSVKLIGNYKRSGGTDVFADLFLIQLYYADNKKQKAIRLLKEIEEDGSRLKTVEQYGFYLYLTTFFCQDASYVDRMEDEIRRLFEADRTNWVLQWILLYLQENLLADDGAKYEAVSRQFDCGCRSRIMYLEAWQILKRNPFMLRRLGNFELHLLRFAAREKVLTEETVLQISGLALHFGAYNRILYEILEAAYESFPSDELVRAVCLLLINGQKKAPEYFRWFELGVRHGLRITGLYEYYMGSMEFTDINDMPQIIRMYFSYDTSLSYEKRAAVYRNILENKGGDPQTYRTHRQAMQKFALEQLEMGHLTEDLAALYPELLRTESLSRPCVEKLFRMLNSYEVVCEAPQMKQIAVCSPYMNEEDVTPLVNGKAVIQVYEPDSAVMAEDQEGSRYPAFLLCSIRRIFENKALLDWCIRKRAESPGAMLYVSSRILQNEEQEPGPNDLWYLTNACERGYFSGKYRDRLRARALSYYAAHPLDETMPEFVGKISIQEYVRVDKAALVTILAEEGQCEQAFELLDRYGVEGIPLIQLVRVCSRMVLASEFEENRTLLALCHYCFASGKYDDKLLRYLLLYYEGPMQDMERIWQAGTEFELDTMLIEEKIITMLLFTRCRTQGTEPVFEAYRKKMGRRKLCLAYVNMKAYEYFVKGIPVAASVFRYIEHDYEELCERGRKDGQEDVCRLALLQYYANCPSLDERQEAFAKKLLEEYNAKNMRFAFWMKFGEKLLAPYQMDGKVYIEYAADPKNTVTLYFRKDSRDDFRKENMRNCFEGIFVREFTLFYGEELECYLEETSDGTVKRSDTRYLRAGSSDARGYTKYGLLNDLLRAKEQEDEKTLREELETFVIQEYLSKELFTLI